MNLHALRKEFNIIIEKKKKKIVGKSPCCLVKTAYANNQSTKYLIKNVVRCYKKKFIIRYCKFSYIKYSDFSVFFFYSLWVSLRDGMVIFAKLLEFLLKFFSQCGRG